MIRRPPRSPLFPSTTPSRSSRTCLLPPTNLTHLSQSHHPTPRLRPIRGPQDARQFQLIDYPRRSPVPDAHAPLQQRGGADLILDAHLGGLPEQMVALAQVLSRLPALLPIL